MILSLVLFCVSMASGKESVMLPKNIQSVLKHRNLNPSSLSVLIVDLENDVRLNIELSQNSDVLQEVVVEAEASDINTTGTEMGQIDLSMEKII